MITLKKIADLRKKKGLNQKEFGKLIGAAQNTVCNWENGKREPDNDTLIKIADFFGVTTDYLLGTKEKPPLLKGDDAKLIKDYHRLSEKKQQVVRNSSRALLSSSVRLVIMSINLIAALSSKQYTPQKLTAVPPL